MSTLKNLVNETTNIKNEIITCYAELKSSLIDKGVEISDNDKLNDLIDKTSLINGSKYKLNVKVNAQEDEPQSPNYGDIWLPLSKGDYNLNFSPNNIENPTDKDLHIKVSNLYVEFNLDESIKDFMQGLRNDFSINLIANSFENNHSNSVIPLLANGVSKIFARIGISKVWDSSTNEWVRVYGKYWNGTGWVGFTSDEGIFYTVDNYTLKALKIDTFETIWSYTLTKAYDASVTVGQSSIAVFNAPGTYNELCEVYFLDFNGNLIVKDSEETRLSNWYGSKLAYCKDGSFIRYYRSGSSTYFIKYSELTGETIAVKNVGDYIYSSFTEGINIIDDLIIISHDSGRYLYAMDTSLENIFTVFNNTLYHGLLVLKDKTIGLLHYSSNKLTIKRIKINKEAQNYTHIEDLVISVSMGTSASFAYGVTIDPNTLEEIIIIGDKVNDKIIAYYVDGRKINETAVAVQYINELIGYEGGNFIGLCDDSVNSYNRYVYFYSFKDNEFNYRIFSSSMFRIGSTTSSGVLGTFDENYGL